MNRIELISVFTALEVLCEKKDVESIERIVKATLLEAKTKDAGDKKNK